ncbi:MAG: transcriptional regulator, AraC family [Glaciihabitans sp.]|nr:transcriptional regulator, AraC family [Glaciihabitans sp.]
MPDRGHSRIGQVTAHFQNDGTRTLGRVTIPPPPLLSREPVAPGRAGRLAGAADTRSLPLYEAGSVDVDYAITSTHEHIVRDTHWEEHSHPTHELLWNERGASSTTVGSRVWTVTPSVGLWIPAGVAHSGWTPAGTAFRAEQFSVHTVPSISAEPVAVDVTPLLQLLLERLNSGGLTAASRATTEAMVLDVLAPAPHHLLLSEPESALLAPIVETARRDPADSTSLEDWARRLGVSTRTITRIFRAETGLNFSQWIASSRAQHAIVLLAGGDGIDDVALQVGYRSASAFGTAFRRVTGMSPGRFRAI